MSIRTILLAASALFLSIGIMAPSADAATSRRAARHAAQKPAGHHGAMHRGAMRPGRGAAMAGRTRGRDAESASVDQLNAQSLAAARGGAAPAAR